MIISASRRTDIPAFYTPWFLRRVQEGYLLVRNPFNTHQVRRVSISASSVEAIVFWTRNAAPLLPHLHELDGRGLHYYFQYTITGYSRSIEPSVPRTLQAIETFKRLSERIGPGRLVWRYDPILLSNMAGYDEHRRLFEKIAQLLHGYTRRAVISFADFYKKTERNLRDVPGLSYTDALAQTPPAEALAAFMAKVARANGMAIQTCSEGHDFTGSGVPHGKCIDDEILREEFGVTVSKVKDKGQRDECGCIKSVDIGQYNTCKHGCAYCYATFNHAAVAKNSEKHDESSPLLIGVPDAETPSPAQLDMFE